MENYRAVKDIRINADLTCYHCHQPCEETLWQDEKPFCCYGCKTVYEILSSNDLCEYYSLDENAGTQQKKVSEETYAYLDESDIRKKVIEFDSETFTRVRLYIPAIHCVSCIWLLENLQKINSGILKSEVNFTSKSVGIDFNPGKAKLSEIALLLDRLGYAPRIVLEKESARPVKNRSLVIKLAVAGFCFGNVMLFSFPEYLGLDQSDEQLRHIFAWLNFGLSIPALLYSGKDYFTSALLSFRQKQINIDVPIAVGLLALFFRSSYDIITGIGPGYFDSFTGLVFFLLIGRWFQGKTYQSLAFDRDFKSYFPLAVQKLEGNDWRPVVIYELRQGDHIRIRNMEIIPADSILLEDTAYIDYSFVTGESRPVKVSHKQLVYAGGRLIGQPATLEVEKSTSQSHLTSLWNHEAFRKIQGNNYQKVIDRAARMFTWVVMGIALVTFGYWYVFDASQMWLVTTSVLMVACPCALALAVPFTYGSMLREFGRHQFYLKNADVIEHLASIDTVVFDKTGTVTLGEDPEISFVGELSAKELAWIKLLTSYSTHPLSNVITRSVRETSPVMIYNFRELPGKGIEGVAEGHLIRIGSAIFTGFKDIVDTTASCVFVSIDDDIKGHFRISASVRKNIKGMLERLGGQCAALLSGDNDADRKKMGELFSPSTELLFNQSAHDKLEYIRTLQEKGKNVLMAGDGLNDSGALKQSNVGISVSDDTGVFTPACDGILKGEKLSSLDKFLSLAKASSSILRIAFTISFFYNAVALGFAVSGHLTPLVAAVLMPMSSISVVSFSSLAVRYVASRKRI